MNNKAVATVPFQEVYLNDNNHTEDERFVGKKPFRRGAEKDFRTEK